YPGADYCFASLRKWGAVAGAGFACKQGGSFAAAQSVVINESYLSLRKDGYARKAQYMDHGEGGKDVFLKLFHDAEARLDGDYIGYGADGQSLADACQIASTGQQRLQNATLLSRALARSRLVRLVYSMPKADDRPLFVPVLVQRGLRDSLRAHLVENAVYCPVHWSRHSALSHALYGNELSLVCDQRYGKDDMQRQIDLIESFEKRWG
nr:hypothetical protein [Clostridia bacterium]